jgi:hypothetical protein
MTKALGIGLPLPAMFVGVKLEMPPMRWFLQSPLPRTGCRPSTLQQAWPTTRPATPSRRRRRSSTAIGLFANVALGKIA